VKRWLSALALVVRKRRSLVLPPHCEIASTARLTAACQIYLRDPQDCSLVIGEESNVEARFVFEKEGAAIHIGARTHLGGNSLFAAAQSITVGDDVLIAFDVLITDHNSHSLHFPERRDDVSEWMRGRKDWTHVRMAPVVIGDKAWIGARAIILKGVTIGEGAIVGAGSVVTKAVSPWTLVAGNPARVVRELTP
jgi:acetyltransferase-like isoleucine patch superfamily enzyme